MSKVEVFPGLWFKAHLMGDIFLLGILLLAAKYPRLREGIYEWLQEQARRWPSDLTVA